MDIRPVKSHLGRMDESPDALTCSGCGSVGAGYITNGEVTLCAKCRLGQTKLDVELFKQTGCGLHSAIAAIGILNELGRLNNKVILAVYAVKELAALPRCCGNEFTNSAGSLYMHHSLSDICPIHGAAENGAARGLRSYIGKDPDKQAAAREAASAYANWQAALEELQKARRALDSMDAQLKAVAYRQGRMTL